MKSTILIAGLASILLLLAYNCPIVVPVSIAITLLKLVLVITRRLRCQA